MTDLYSKIPTGNIEYDLAPYEWIVVIGCLMAFFAAFGIGANDVANAYATSVGSKALTIKQACVLAVIFEFLGAVCAGSAVSSTIRKGIAKSECFEDDPALLMYGCLSVISAVGIWLLVASAYEMPVSTTHSCVGGMIGMTIVAKGANCVIWAKAGTEEKLYLPQGVSAIVLSWVFSPVFSGIFSVLLFKMTRGFVLRAKNSFRNAIRFYPVLICMAVTINVFFVLAKGVKSKICPKSAIHKSWLCLWKYDEDEGEDVPRGMTNPGTAFGLALGIGVGVAVAGIPVYRWIERKVKADFNLDGAGKSSSTADSMSVDPKDVGMREATPAAAPTSVFGKMTAVLMTSLNNNPHEAITQDAKVAAIHANAEKFEPETEAVFRYIQIFTAICDSFAHGANDVANAMGPFMAIYFIYKEGEVVKKYNTEDGDANYWILAIGGIGIGAGLCLYGYKIMRAIGVKLAVVTPSRGVSIELGAAIVIIIGSYLGIPLSTTHCQVGATTGVALLEGSKGLNKIVLLKAVVGWVITLIVVGITTGVIFSQGAYAPLAIPTKDALFSDWYTTLVRDGVCTAPNATAIMEGSA